MNKFEILFETEDFESMLSQSMDKSNFQEGQLLSGKINKIDDSFVYIDVGLKSFGKVPISEFLPEELKVGEDIIVVLTSIEKSDGSIGLSREEVKKSEVKKQLEQSFINKEKVSGFAFASFKSGFKVNLSGIGAFLPRNQIDIKSSKSDIPLNTPMLFVISSMDEDCKNVVVSLKEARDIDKKAAKREFINSFEAGQVIENCMVKNIASYGAFIDIGGGHDGLLHITDMSWKRLHHPNHAGVEKGATLDKVIILKVDKEAGHVSLGLKQLNKDPWSIIVDKLKPGQIVDGIVTNIVEYGAFIELEGFNIEGLAHVSELSWESRNVVPTDVLHQNQKLKVQILAVDPSKRRVSLSVKNCIKNPWSLIAENYTPGTEIEGTIKNISEFGISVELKDGIRGMVHVSDVSWSREDSEKIKNNYKTGEKINVKILSVVPSQNKIKLGIKQLSENPHKKQLDELVIGDIIPCKVKGVFDTEIEVVLPNGLNGFIKKSEFSMNKDYSSLPKFKVADSIEAQIISIRYDSAKVELSIKKLEEDEYRKGMKEFSSNESASATLFEISSEKR